jgi:hypothetical protein
MSFSINHRFFPTQAWITIHLSFLSKKSIRKFKHKMSVVSAQNSSDSKFTNLWTNDKHCCTLQHSLLWGDEELRKPGWRHRLVNLRNQREVICKSKTQASNPLPVLWLSPTELFSQNRAIAGGNRFKISQSEVITTLYKTRWVPNEAI